MPQKEGAILNSLIFQLLILLVGESSVPPPLKPNLIELGRYRKIDRESVTCRWRFRTWGMGGFKKSGNRPNEFWEWIGGIDLIHLDTYLGPSHHFTSFALFTQTLNDCRHLCPPFRVLNSTWFWRLSGRNCPAMFLIVGHAGKYVIAGNYLNVLLSWLYCDDVVFPWFRWFLTL